MYRLASSLLLAALAVTSLATGFDDSVGLEKRQTQNSSTTSVQPTSPSSQRTTTPSVAVTSSTVTVSPTSVSVSVTSITSTITPSSGTSTGSPSVSTSVSSASYEVSVSYYTTNSPSQFTQTITRTTNGQVETATSTGSRVVPVTTSAQVTSLLSSSGSSGSSGLSETNKKVIGGVVGGVGGALLLGALAFTAWRIWGRKKNYHDDDLYDPNSQQEKLQSSTEGSNNTPFQSTLDQYHRPGPVNTAANF